MMWLDMSCSRHISIKVHQGASCCRLADDCSLYMTAAAIQYYQKVGHVSLHKQFLDKGVH